MSKYQELSTSLWDKYKVADHPAIAFALDMSWQAAMRDEGLEMYIGETQPDAAEAIEGWESLDFYLTDTQDKLANINRRACLIYHQRKVSGPIMVFYKEYRSPPVVTIGGIGYGASGIYSPNSKPVAFVVPVGYSIPKGVFGKVTERSNHHVVNDVFRFLAHGIRI